MLTRVTLRRYNIYDSTEIRGVWMGKVILYHGSSHIVRNPEYGKGKLYNDYGQGFYCTEHLELAKEWSCTEGVDGYANEYEIETDGLNTLNLSSDDYTVLHWLALLMEHRRFRIATPVMKKGAEWLRANFLPDIEDCDIIIGYRADDSYFSFARAFVNNEISLEQLSYSMRLGKLGEQVVLKSRKAFDNIRFLSYVPVDSTEYYAKRKLRDDDARMAYRVKMDEEDIDGLYMRDIIREEVKPDDSRLR